MITSRPLEGTISTSDVRTHLSAVLERVRRTRAPLVIVKRGQEQGVLLGLDEYRRLNELDEREKRRRQTLSHPIEANSTAESWQASFDTLTRIRENAAYLSDDELDALVNETLAEVRRSTPGAAG
jgi:prevent-host-death family protein